MPIYKKPWGTRLDEDDVRIALNFLIEVEPDPPPDSRNEYEAATAPFQSQIADAMATLREFAEQAANPTLEQMQMDYYGFTNDAKYLRSSDISAIVRGALDEAWNGIGPWRR